MSGYISDRCGVEDSQVTNDLKNVAGKLLLALKIVGMFEALIYLCKFQAIWEKS